MGRPLTKKNASSRPAARASASSCSDLPEPRTDRGSTPLRARIRSAVTRVPDDLAPRPTRRPRRSRTRSRPESARTTRCTKLSYARVSATTSSGSVKTPAPRSASEAVSPSENPRLASPPATSRRFSTEASVILVVALTPSSRRSSTVASASSPQAKTPPGLPVATVSSVLSSSLHSCPQPPSAQAAGATSPARSSPRRDSVDSGRQVMRSLCWTGRRSFRAVVEPTVGRPLPARTAPAHSERIRKGKDMFSRHGVPRERIDVLREVPFFEGLSTKVLARIDQHLDDVTVPPRAGCSRLKVRPPTRRSSSPTG